MKSMFRGIAVVLINAFLLIDISWAGGGMFEIDFSQQECLSPKITFQLNELIQMFNVSAQDNLGNESEQLLALSRYKIPGEVQLMAADFARGSILPETKQRLISAYKLIKETKSEKSLKMFITSFVEAVMPHTRNVAKADLFLKTCFDLLNDLRHGSDIEQILENDFITMLIDIDKPWDSKSEKLSEKFLKMFYNYNSKHKSQKKQLVLASQSPRREHIIKQVIRIDDKNFKQEVVAGDEILSELGDFESKIIAIAYKKALRVAEMPSTAGYVFAADTSFLSEKGIFQKPALNNPQAAFEMLKKHAGKTLEAVSSLAIIDTKKGDIILDYGTALVTFKNLEQRLNNREVAVLEQESKTAEGVYLNELLKDKQKITVEQLFKAYAFAGKSEGKAGALGLQDRDLFAAVERVKGDPLSVIGMPFDPLTTRLRDLEIKTDKVDDVLKHYWKTEGEIAKVEYETKKSVLRKLVEFEMRFNRQMEKGERILAKAEETGQINGIVKAYMYLITISKKNYKLGHALYYCQLLSEIKESQARLPALSRIIERFDPGKYDFNFGFWDNTSLPALDLQTELFRLLDRMVNEYNGWDKGLNKHMPAIYGRIRIPRNHDAFLAEYSNNLLFSKFDQYHQDKKKLYEKSFLELVSNIKNLKPDDLDSQSKILEQIKNSLDMIAQRNIGSDLSRGHGIDRNGIIQDDRDYLLPLLKNWKINALVEGKPRIAVFTDNAGDEAVATLWLTYLMLRLGMSVTLYSPNAPTLVSDATTAEMVFLVPYFDGLLKRILGKDAPVLSDYYLDNKKGELRFFNVDADNSSEKAMRGFLDNELKEKLPRYNSAFLIGELWYGYFVGLKDFNGQPYLYTSKDMAEDMKENKSKKRHIHTNVFSVHAHKNLRQRLFLRNIKPHEEVGIFVDPDTSRGDQVFQLFSPRDWQKEEKTFYFKGNDQISKLMSQDENRQQIIKGLYEAMGFFFNVQEPRSSSKLPIKITEFKDQGAFIFEYKTPSRIISVRLREYPEPEEKQMIGGKLDVFNGEIEISMSMNFGLLERDTDLSEDSIDLRKAEWPTTRVKIPSLIRGHFAKFFGKNTTIIDPMKNYVRTKVDLEDNPFIRVKQKKLKNNQGEISHADVNLLDIFLPIENINNPAIDPVKMYDYYKNKGVLFARIIRMVESSDSEGMGYISSIIPVWVNPRSKKLRATIPNFKGKIQIVSIFGSNNDDGEITEFTPADWFYQIQDEKTPTDKINKYYFKPEKLDIETMSNVIPGPLDQKTTAVERVILHNLGGSDYEYSDLVRIGGIFSPINAQTKDFWEDYEYITGLPRFDLSSQEKAIVQLSGPHDCSLESQLFNDDEAIVKTFVRAARIAEYNGAVAIDINTGSTVGASTDKGGGSNYIKKFSLNEQKREQGDPTAIPEEEELIYKIVSGIKGAVKIPVTVKTRIALKFLDGNNSQSAKGSAKSEASLLYTQRFAELVAKAGADLLVIHTRTANESFQSGRAIVRWSWIKDVKNYLKDSYEQGRIPKQIKVYCNGEANDPVSGKKMLEVSQADGIMIATSIMGNPFIIGQTKENIKNGYYQPVTVIEAFDAAFKEIEYQDKMMGEFFALEKIQQQFQLYFKFIKKIIPGFKDIAEKYREEVDAAKSIEQLKSIHKRMLKSALIFIKNNPRYIINFKDFDAKQVNLVGGKGASLAELAGIPGIAVPNGFNVSTLVFDEFVEAAGIKILISELDDLSQKLIKIELDKDLSDTAKEYPEQEELRKKIEALGQSIQKRMSMTEMPEHLKEIIAAAYGSLGKGEDMPVAVRSSADAEDMPVAAFAGQHESLLNQIGKEQVLAAVKKCWESLFSPHAISYRNNQRVKELKKIKANKDISNQKLLAENTLFKHTNVKLSLVIQEMVDAKKAGVAFNVIRRTGKPGIEIEANYGIGESVVDSGKIVPDKWELDENGDILLLGILGNKLEKVISKQGGGSEYVEVAPEDQENFCLSQQEVLSLGEKINIIGEHYRLAYGYKYVDIEFAMDKNGEIYFVQTRPETVVSQQTGNDQFTAKVKDDIKVEPIAEGGDSVCFGVAKGRLRVITLSENPDEQEIMKIRANIKQGDILVLNKTVPAAEPIMYAAGALVTEFGGRNSHTAIVGSEMDKPIIVGMNKAREILSAYEGQIVTFDASQRKIYLGDLSTENVEKSEVELKRYFDQQLESNIKRVMDSFGQKQDERKIGRPFHPMGKLQTEMYSKAFDLLEEKTGISVVKGADQVEGGYFFYTPSNENWTLYQMLEKKGISGMQALLNEREITVSNFENSARRFDGTSSSFKALIDSYVEMIAYFHFRWMFKNISEKLYNEMLLTLPLEERRFVDTVFIAELSNAHTIKKDKDEKIDSFAKLLAKYEDLIKTGSAEKVIATLKQENPILFSQVEGFADELPLTDSVDFRLASSPEGIISKVKDYFLSGKENAKKLVPKALTGIIDTRKEVQEVFDLNLSQLIQTENEHISQISLQYRMRKVMLNIAKKMVEKNVLSSREEIFELEINELLSKVKEYEQIEYGITNIISNETEAVKLIQQSI